MAFNEVSHQKSSGSSRQEADHREIEGGLNKDRVRIAPRPQSGLHWIGHERNPSPMARFLEEPSHEHGLAFDRTGSRAALALKIGIAEHQGEHDLAHVGAQFDIDIGPIIGLEIEEDMLIEEEKLTDSIPKQKESAASNMSASILRVVGEDVRF